MRKILLLATCVACLGSPAAWAQLFSGEIKVDLSPTDPKYNTPQCVSMREKARTYNNGTLQEQAGSFILGMGAPGGGLAVAGGQYRRREMVQQQVEQACMSNPPSRPHLDPAATTTKD